MLLHGIVAAPVAHSSGGGISSNRTSHAAAHEKDTEPTTALLGFQMVRSEHQSILVPAGGARAAIV